MDIINRSAKNLGPRFLHLGSAADVIEDVERLLSVFFGHNEQGVACGAYTLFSRREGLFLGPKDVCHEELVIYQRRKG